VRPNDDVRPFAALRGRLELVGEPIRGLNFNRDPEIFFKFLGELSEAAPTLVNAYPNEEFAVRPGKCPNRGEEYEDYTEEVLAHRIGELPDANARG
jgi:hypothetical protein